MGVSYSGGRGRGDSKGEDAVFLPKVQFVLQIRTRQNVPDCIGEACVVQDMRRMVWRTRRQSVPNQVDECPGNRLLKRFWHLRSRVTMQWRRMRVDSIYGALLVASADEYGP